jgi:hypothetical protein
MASVGVVVVIWELLGGWWDEVRFDEGGELSVVDGIVVQPATGHWWHPLLGQALPRWLLAAPSTPPSSSLTSQAVKSVSSGEPGAGGQATHHNRCTG